MKELITLMLLSLAAFSWPSHAQTGGPSILNKERIAGLIIKGDISAILTEVGSVPLLSEEDKSIKQAFEKRFKYKSDKSEKLKSGDKKLDQLCQIYREYWRKSLLDSNNNYDTLMAKKLNKFYIKEKMLLKPAHIENDNALLNNIQISYIQKRGYFTAGFGKTLFLYDLFIWKNQKDTIYKVEIMEETFTIKVIFMDNFLSRGWLEYAYSTPGGWATKDTLFCVASHYSDFTSESFLAHYLKHESQHYIDNNRYPKLSESDLEYRAKLIELIYATQSLFPTMDKFINQANYDRNNAHSFAAFCIIRDLSKDIFNNNFENNIEIWKDVSQQEISLAAKNLYQKHTAKLNQIGKDAKDVIY
jgi:hypothetical protein